MTAKQKAAEKKFIDLMMGLYEEMTPAKRRRFESSLHKAVVKIDKREKKKLKDNAIQIARQCGKPRLSSGAGMNKKDFVFH